MTDMKDRSSFERLLRPLRHELTAEFAAALLRMQADDELQTRYEYLAERNTESLLDSEEQIELASLVRAQSYAATGQISDKCLPQRAAFGRPLILIKFPNYNQLC
jgi:hypothetical protein